MLSFYGAAGAVAAFLLIGGARLVRPLLARLVVRHGYHAKGRRTVIPGWYSGLVAAFVTACFGWALRWSAIVLGVFGLSAFLFRLVASKPEGSRDAFSFEMAIVGVGFVLAVFLVVLGKVWGKFGEGLEVSLDRAIDASGAMRERFSIQKPELSGPRWDDRKDGVEKILNGYSEV